MKNAKRDLENRGERTGRGGVCVPEGVDVGDRPGVWMLFDPGVHAPYRPVKVLGLALYSFAWGWASRGLSGF